MVENWRKRSGSRVKRGKGEEWWGAGYIDRHRRQKTTARVVEPDMEV